MQYTVNTTATTAGADENEKEALEIVSVQHHLVNTASTLYFDSSTGGMVRVQQRQVQPTVNASTEVQAQTQPPLRYACMLSRIDDDVDCPLFSQLTRAALIRATANGATTAAGSQLPTYRIESICDASLVAMETMR